tara:strand:- start:2141 stop:4603 length:2463 start_codon:yes stop_codon:yes gene_type:complete
MTYNHKAIEKKWQAAWDAKKTFKVTESSKKKKYILEMFPYPSGSGLHMGHALNYTIGDIFARFQRMLGFNILYPIGYDALGLPAENAAIKAKSHPKKFTDDAIKNFITQQKALGLSYDWSRVLRTCDVEYYKWNQYFFLKLFEKDLVYRKNAPVNWCSECNTVLANEQVHSGMCWRHASTPVVIKQLEQWFIKTTAYADELLDTIPKLDWPDRIKSMQENWIGKSFGTEINFLINDKSWKIFTTRPDTLFGVTFMVISAQHSQLMDLVTAEQKPTVEKFLHKIHSTSDADLDVLEKDGVFTGSYAIHPITEEKIPIWAGNFVIAEYGSGMVMAVPAHDQRDFEFAKKYEISIKVVIQPGAKEVDPEDMDSAFVNDGVLVNSGKFDGLKKDVAIEEITTFLDKQKMGKKAVQYKLRDWLVSRQRYWGTPIPIVYCDDCGVLPVLEKDLPIVLPEKVKFGEGNPLASNEEFVNTSCPKCKGKARRETDTMDTFFDSSWYFLRYTDNLNKKLPFDKKKGNYWMPVDVYIGGAEHACMHLMYARFFTKALRDLGFVKCDEPFTKLFNQGMLHGEDGHVMAKSRGNVINPLDITKQVGADALRLFLVSVAAPDKDFAWSSSGLESIAKIIKRIPLLFENLKLENSNKKVESKINKAIKEISEDITSFDYNLAVIKLRKLIEDFSQVDEMAKADAESFLKIFHPFCPHLTEELWGKIGNKPFISLADWPKCNEKKIDKKFEQEEELISKTQRDIVHVKGLLKLEKPKVYIYCIPPEVKIFEEQQEFLTSVTGSKFVKVFASNAKDIVDPEKKAKKAKPGRPSIYLE